MPLDISFWTNLPHVKNLMLFVMYLLYYEFKKKLGELVLHNSLGYKAFVNSTCGWNAVLDIWEKKKRIFRNASVTSTQRIELGFYSINKVLSWRSVFLLSQFMKPFLSHFQIYRQSLVLNCFNGHFSYWRYIFLVSNLFSWSQYLFFWLDLT